MKEKTGSSQQYYGYFSDNGYLNYMFKDVFGNDYNGTISGTEFADGNYDGEPDLFFFNFNGYSGKFYFNDDRSAVLMPEEDLKIEYLYTPGKWTGGPGAYDNIDHCIDGFVITTPDGVKYYFGLPGFTQENSFVDPIEVVCPFSLYKGSIYSRTISSWYLNRIESPDGNSIITLKIHKKILMHIII